jgi:hypothetical protein
MKTSLDTAHTWFLEGSAQLPSGELRIRLAEGIKGSERKPVEITDGVVRSLFPVTVQSSSRAVDVIFENAHALFTFNESYDTDKLALITEDRAKLRRVSASSFRKHASATTSIFELVAVPISEWFLWTEDQVFQILATGEPTIVEVPSGPNLTIARNSTWAAN